MAATAASIETSLRSQGCGAVTGCFVTEAHRHFDGNLRRYFLRHGVARDDLEDMLQEVYLRLARQAGVDDIRSAEAFVITIASNLIRDAYRRRGRRGVEYSLEGEGFDAPSEGDDPERSAEYSQHLSAAGRAIGRLRPATRRVFLGHRIRGQSYSELSRELGVSVSMIEKHMIAALSALRPLIGDFV